MFSRRLFQLFLSLTVTFSLLFGGSNLVLAKTPPPPPDRGGGQDRGRAITPQDRQQAAERAADVGLTMPEMGTTAMQMGGEAPHYFGPYPNYANSPLRLADALVEFTGDGTGAAATASVDPATGTITAITVTNGGSGYTTPPTVAISSAVVTTGTGAAATAVITGSVTGLALDSAGTGYTGPVTVEFSGGGGTGAAATATVTPTGMVSEIQLLSGGSGYTTANVALTGGGGTGAAATAVITPDGMIADISLIEGGSGYTSATVEFSGGGGTGAAATATVTPTGFVDQISVTNPGTGYTTAAVTIDGDGTGAAADAVIDATGAIQSITLTNPGAGYSFATITINGDGTGAAADATVDTTHGPVTALTLTAPGLGYTAPLTVAVLGDGTGATAAATLDPHGAITAITVDNPGTGYTSAPVVDITGDGAGAAATALVDTTSGVISGLTLSNAGSGYTTAPVVSFIDAGATGTGAAATASITGAVTAVNVDSGGSGYVTPGIRKFVDSMPGLGSGSANNLGQYIPVAVADTTTYPGSDYYEIAVVQYEEQMHTDLPATTLRGYVQLSTDVVPGAHVALTNLDGSPILLPDGTQAYAVDQPHYMGPLISAERDKPVRILFRNLLPTGMDGNLFIPVDTTVMGSGMGPGMNGMAETDPQNPMCGMMPKPAECYTENRATLHLHGGISPWISDGTPHQWVTPANENTPYPEGVSVENVPDMPDPGPGAMTFFYTNQQSARLMFYHDHSWGITRLNVYAGEAAAYLITDPTEQALIDQGIIPADQIPMIVQDKTFVPSDAQLAVEDPTWDLSKWGGLGELWVPHVYMPAQNPGDSSGVNQFGRWAYGPWFWPPTSNIDYPPVANPYYDPNCDPDVQWCEPPLIPGVPFLSMGMEAFNDTPLVNGTAYPTLTVDPKSYRMRVLNAANDRFFNLSLFQAVDANGVVCDTANTAPAAEASGVACTEVRLNDVAAALEDTTIFPTPDMTTAGPSWIQIGTEGGFLPAPTVIPPHEITWVNDPTVFNAGNVDLHSLLLGPAERADVIVDFSQFAGQTLILYNDAPAAFPARDPRYDYYTGSADLTDTGGAPSISAGYGPNTRTVMQIVVADATPAPAFNLGALQAAFAHHTDGSGVFESSQNPIIVGQGVYNSAYGTAFSTNGTLAGLAQIFSTSLTFKTLTGQTLTIPLEPKAIQDEMGESFEKEYGRMSGNLGLEAPNAQAGLQQNLVLYPYVNPASEVLEGIEMAGLDVTPISSADDGTQIWKITHNGVDTHPIHFHLYDVQVINRVGWDGIIRRPDANELGWKDTLRVSPLEDTIVAMRPIIPKIPFGLVDSIRPLNPMMPIGSTAMFNSTDALGNPIVPAITNQIVNFGWEYVWHCHILSHEEMDMMRPVSVAVSRSLPATPVVTFNRDTTTGAISLTWNDGTPVSYTDLTTWGSPANEVGYRIQRASIAANGVLGAFADIANVLANTAAYTDTSATPGGQYRYRVVAFNAAGDAVSADVGDPVLLPPDAPASLVAALQAGPQISLTWNDNASSEASFRVERAVDGGAFAFLADLPAFTGTGSTSYIDTTVTPGHSYRYQIAAVNPAGASAFAVSNTITIAALTLPNTPSSLVAALQAGPQISLTWNDRATNEASFRLERGADGGGYVFLADLPAFTGTGTASYIDTTVAAGHRYRYRIAAVNSAGTSAYASSNIITIAALTRPTAPSNLVATVQAGPQVSLTWNDNASNEASFRVERAVDGGAFAFLTNLPAFTGTGSTSYIDTTVTTGHSYRYRAAAVNVAGTSSYTNSNTVTVGTLTRPTAPSSLVAALQAGPQISLTWRDNASNEASFRLERGADGGGYVFLANLPAFTGTGTASYIDTTVAAGHRYRYRIAAVNGAGTSAYTSSNIITIP